MSADANGIGGTVGVICDLDGTLAHTAPSIHRAGQLMLDELDLPGVEFEDAMPFIGDGLNRFVKRMLTRDMWAEPEHGVLEKGLRIMRERYAENLTWGCELFPGVEETLGELAGMECAMGCVTNKPQGFAARVLEHFGIGRHFSVLVGGDTLDEKKPHPKPLLHCMELLGVRADNSILVGDGPADSKACGRAGVARVGSGRGADVNVEILGGR